MLELFRHIGPDTDAPAGDIGGVAVSGLEMSQNSMRLRWSAEEVDPRLRGIMKEIYRTCAEAYSCAGNYLAGANIAGYTKVAGAMIDQGLV
ncbi:MAG: hypothetical protein ACOX5Z_10495 [Desulfobulbus sp.]